VVKDPPGYKPRLKVMYLENVAKDLKEEFGYKSVMQIPKLSKIIVSTGLGEAIANKKLLDSASAEIQQITGRKPVRTKAKKSIANFKVRKDMDLGIMVTLRGNVMYEFLDRLVNVAMPRIKDFRGANPNAFDGHGNYSLGVTEQIIFPEIDYDKIERVSGMNIAVVTSAKTDQEARSLLARLACRSANRTQGETNGTKSGNREIQREAEIQHAPDQQVQSVRPTEGYLRKFKLCRICFRSLASSGMLPGVTKSSW